MLLVLLGSLPVTTLQQAYMPSTDPLSSFDCYCNWLTSASRMHLQSRYTTVFVHVDRCKPQVLPTDTMGPMSVSAIASEMLERGWVTREEHTQLLLGDRYDRKGGGVCSLHVCFFLCVRRAIGYWGFVFLGATAVV